MEKFDNLSYEHILAREMYMHFGYTICLSQNFEKGLASVLRGMLANEKHIHKMSYEKFLEQADKFNEKTLGWLLKEVKSLLPTEVIPESLFQKALDLRNHLVHDYFFENGSKETVTDGKIAIIKEMVEYQKVFEEAIRWTDKMNRDFLYKIGMTDEKLAARAEKLRQEEVSIFRAGLPLNKLC